MRLTLDPDRIALHQLLSLAPDPAGDADLLSRSPLFAVTLADGGVVADWIQASPEDDPVPYPLGRVTVGRFGVLLETFSEERMEGLIRCVRECGAAEVSRDQVRVLPVAEAVAFPEHVLQPLRDQQGDTLTKREIAAMYLTMAWPFRACEALGGRRPEAVLRTPGAAESLEPVLEGLARELRAEIPTFPAFAADEIHELLDRSAAPRSRAAAPAAGKTRKD